MRHEKNHRVTRDREKVEGDERVPMTPPIDQHAARIGVDRAEQSPERVEQADNENARAERLEIFWNETNPEFFARANDERRDQKDHQVAFEAEEFRSTSPKIHDSDLTLSKT